MRHLRGHHAGRDAHAGRREASQGDPTLRGQDVQPLRAFHTDAARSVIGKPMRRTIIVAVIASLGLLVLIAPWPGPASPRGDREIRVRAGQYAYTPGVLRVAQGERVTLILEAEDVTHGLYVDRYGVDLVAIPGRSSRATFIADRPGRFQLRCSQVCGTLHPFMMGEFVVEPNSPFWRAVGLAILAAIGTVAFLRATPRDTSGSVSA